MKKSIFLFLAITFAISFASATEYATYDKVVAQIDKLVADHPSYIQKMDIGKNDQQQFIYGMRIENLSYVEDGGKPNHLVVGAHHGNERWSADISLRFALRVVEQMKNPQAAYHKQLSACVFYVIPVLNIGGYNANRRSEVSAQGKYLDPNRDYADPCAKNVHSQLASTRNLATFMERYNVIGAVTIHGYIGTFTFPWGIYTSNTKTKDHDTFQAMATQSVKANSYRIGTHTDVIYAAVGAFEDWAYHKHGIWTMLLEMKNYPDVEKDALCTLIYFSVVPKQRSTQHEHVGQCTNTSARDEEDAPSRP